MKEELAAAAALAAEAWAKGREEHSDLRSWEALSGLARVLVASLSSGLASRAEEAELRAKLAAMTARLQAVFGLGAADAQVATPNKIVGFEVEATSSSTVAVTLNSGAAEFVPNGHAEDGAEEEEGEDEEDDDEDEDDEEDEEYEDAPLSAEKS